eukprot:1195013-Prorocentrum_minimum.AAC.1
MKKARAKSARKKAPKGIISGSTGATEPSDRPAAELPDEEVLIATYAGDSDEDDSDADDF